MTRNEPRKAPASTDRRPGPAPAETKAAPPARRPAPAPARGGAPDLHQTNTARELFWHNVMREILTSLSIAGLAKRDAMAERAASERRELPAQAEAAVEAAPGEQAERTDPEGPEESDEEGAGLFDGRLAVLTRSGERIPIAEVFPLFACGVDGTSGERWLSTAVECTVFQIRTPGGEVYTLPLHELRGFHALTPELMRKLERMSRHREESGKATTDGEERMPFGFAAFTTLARGITKPADLDQPAI